MTLNDIRRMAIRNQIQVRFSLSNGMNCLVNEQGLAKVPELRAAPTFELEEELARAADFDILTAAKIGSVPRRVSRKELEMMATAATGAAAVQTAEHDE